jgi:hypothetical protein
MNGSAAMAILKVPFKEFSEDRTVNVAYRGIASLLGLDGTLFQSWKIILEQKSRKLEKTQNIFPGL